MFQNDCLFDIQEPLYAEKDTEEHKEKDFAGCVCCLKCFLLHAQMSGAFRFAFADVPPNPPTKGSSACSETMRSNAPQVNSTSSRPAKAAHVSGISKTVTKILVIGGTQFMGRHLVQQLLDEEENVQVPHPLMGDNQLIGMSTAELLVKTCPQCTHPNLALTRDSFSCLVGDVDQPGQDRVPFSHRWAAAATYPL